MRQVTEITTTTELFSSELLSSTEEVSVTVVELESLKKSEETSVVETQTAPVQHIGAEDSAPQLEVEVLEEAEEVPRTLVQGKSVEEEKLPLDIVSISSLTVSQPEVVSAYVSETKPTEVSKTTYCCLIAFNFCAYRQHYLQAPLPKTMLNKKARLPKSLRLLKCSRQDLQH